MVDSQPVPVPSSPKDPKAAAQAVGAVVITAAVQSRQAPAAPSTQGGHGLGAGTPADASAAAKGAVPADGPKTTDKVYSCTWRSGQEYPARVIERKQVEGKWEYYVHYEEFDRRLDEWVSADRMGDEIIKNKSATPPAPVASPLAPSPPTNTGHPLPCATRGILNPDPWRAGARTRL